MPPPIVAHKPMLRGTPFGVNSLIMTQSWLFESDGTCIGMLTFSKTTHYYVSGWGPDGMVYLGHSSNIPRAVAMMRAQIVRLDEFEATKAAEQDTV